jgi:hypothetical protein
VIRRVLFAVLGIVLAFAGLRFFARWFYAEPGFGPQSTDMAIAEVLLGIALGAAGIWLVRLSVRSKD